MAETVFKIKSIEFTYLAKDYFEEDNTKWSAPLDFAIYSFEAEVEIA